MSTPVATVADALISFILSLLRDPAAVEEFDAAPKAALASHGLQDACVADVQAVKPVIVDHPAVVMKPAPPTPTPPPPPSHHDTPDEVIKEIRHIVNQFTTVDARTTIVDQSTNQNIWTNGGDVTQIFDQDAVVASGDGSVAAGDDATIVDSEVDVTVGDVSVGNTTADGSFNNTGVLPPVEEVETTVIIDEVVSDAAAVAGDAVEDAVDTAVDTALDTSQDAVEAVPAEAPAPEPSADPLEADMTSADSYESDDAGMIVDEPYVEEPTEDQ
jgi:hypothetical protein